MNEKIVHQFISGIFLKNLWFFFFALKLHTKKKRSNEENGNGNFKLFHSNIFRIEFFFFQYETNTTMNYISLFLFFVKLCGIGKVFSNIKYAKWLSSWCLKTMCMCVSRKAAEKKKSSTSSTKNVYVQFHLLSRRNSNNSFVMTTIKCHMKHHHHHHHPSRLLNWIGGMYWFWYVKTIERIFESVQYKAHTHTHTHAHAHLFTEPCQMKKKEEERHKIK